MAGMAVSTGMISGIDYTTMISQLMQVEANPQTLLKNQLSATKSDAAAYRAINTRFDALRTAAAAVTADAAWTTTKASSSDTSVVATASASATAGSLSFTVTNLAATHSVYSSGTWPTAGTALNANGPTTLTVAGKDVTIAAGGTVDDAVKAINDAGAGVSAVAVRTGSGVRLQLTSNTSGAAGAFTVTGDVPVTTLTTGVDATLRIGGTLGYDVTSASNTFTDVLPGSTFTVSKKDAAATVTIAKDPDATAAKVQSLVDSANSLLTAISSYTDAQSSSAVLTGNTTLRGLANQVLDVFSRGFEGVSGATVGLQLAPKGAGLVFDKKVFTDKLAADPAAVKDMLTKTFATGPGTDGIAGNADDVRDAVGFAAKFEKLAKNAADATTGILTLAAQSQDSTAKDLESRIAAWDTRLDLREAALTRQFTAMEKALSAMQNQASWLSGQIAGLPSWSR